jgi:type I restriction enzyme S subunit
MENQLIPKLRFPQFEDRLGQIKLGDICTIKTGKKDTQNRIEDGKYPFYVRSNTIERINSYSFDGEAILTSGDGVGVGKNFHYIDGKFDYHQRVYALHSFDKSFHGKFIYQIFKEKFYKRVMRLSAKNSVDSVRMDMISSMPISFPTLPEQQKIASFLTAVDTKITQLTKKKALLEQYKKGVMQKIFKQEIRFKDDNGNNYPNWETKKLGEISFKKSSNISANNLDENTGDFIIYGASGVLKKIDFYREEEPYISIVKDGAGVGRVFICEPKTSVLGTMDIINIKEGNNLYFIYSILQRIYFVKYTTGSTIPHIYFKDYSKEKINVPCLKEQTKIANFLRAIDKKTALVNTQLNTTKTFKKGLLQQLFV